MIAGKKTLELEISVSKAFMAKAIGVAFDEAYYLDPLQRHETDLRCHDHVDAAFAGFDFLFTESNLGRRRYFDRSQALVGGIQPNMLVGMLLGAEFIPVPDSDADITPACWAGRPVEDLPTPESLVTHPLIHLFDDQIRMLQAGGKLIPIPPFFWDASGRAAIHGTLTSAQKFLGENVFVDMLMEPERIRRMMDWITETYRVLVKHFAEICGQKIEAVHVGECSSCMVGAGEWETFVLPNLNRIGAELGRVRLHSCGQSDHILESARKIKNLYSLDLGGESSLAKAREVFGPEIEVSMAPPVKLLTNGTLDDLKAWTRTVIEANGKGNLVILCHVEPQYELAMLREWIVWFKKTLHKDT